MTATCASCRHFRLPRPGVALIAEAVAPGTQGFCRRYPPVMTAPHDRTQPGMPLLPCAEWPVVHESYECGEFAPRIEKGVAP